MLIIIIVIVIMHLKTKAHAWQYYLLQYNNKKSLVSTRLA